MEPSGSRLGGHVGICIPEVNEVPGTPLFHSKDTFRWCGVKGGEVGTFPVGLNFEEVRWGFVGCDLFGWSLGNEETVFSFEGVARSGVGARVVVFWCHRKVLEGGLRLPDHLPFFVPSKYLECIGLPDAVVVEFSTLHSPGLVA